MYKTSCVSLVIWWNYKCIILSTLLFYKEFWPSVYINGHIGSDVGHVGRYFGPYRMICVKMIFTKLYVMFISIEPQKWFIDLYVSHIVLNLKACVVNGLFLDIFKDHNFFKHVSMPMVGIHVRFEGFLTSYASCHTSNHLSAFSDREKK